MINNRDSNIAKQIEQKKKKMKSSEDKEKKKMMIAYSVVGSIAIVVMIIGVFFSMGNQEEKKIDFETPEIESEKYNSKTQALETKNKKRKSQSLLDAFGGNDIKKDTIQKYLEEKALKKELALLNKTPKTNKPLLKQTNKRPKIKVEPIKKEVPKKELTFNERLILSRQKKTNPTPKKSTTKKVEFPAVINGNQIAYDNAMITVRVLNDVPYNNNVLQQNTYLYGVAKIIKTGRVKINFSSMTQGDKRIPINLTAYDQLDGYEGLIINDQAVLVLLKKETADEVNSEISRVGRIGRVLSSVLGKKKKEVKIDLYDEHQIILKGTL
jgi:hypothetical protein